VIKLKDRSDAISPLNMPTANAYIRNISSYRRTRSNLNPNNSGNNTNQKNVKNNKIENLNK